MNKNYYIGISVAVLLLLVIWGLYFMNNKTPIGEIPNLDVFAKCLAEKNIVMYGAEWCTHCKAEKDRFGSSFQYVKYVKCSDNTALCTEKGIEGFPTWEIEGKLYEGEQGLSKLSELSGCELPQNK